MKVYSEEGLRPIKAWVGGIDEIEESALVQAKNLARLPFIASNGVALMPDVHAGKGSTVGSVIATTKAIVPAAVGVDIGCGMVAVRTSLKASDLPDSLLESRLQIERDVPLGAGGANGRETEVEDNWVGREQMFKNIQALVAKHPQIEQRGDAWKGQLGSLGSGNHFIELCIDESQDVWVMLHSGSRGFGNKIGSYFIEQAMELMTKFYIDLPDRDLAYLPEGTPQFDDYVAAVAIGQEYAFQNRAVMLKRVIAALQQTIGKPFVLTNEAINCHHNYVERENHFGQNLWVTRKGAIQARQGSLGIIPGSMGQKSYIVCGKGHAESYCSCSHGAGRTYSRSKARKMFNLEDLVAQTQGVECRKDDGVLDEIPGAYKDIDKVMENQRDLVDVVHTLKQVLCVKGT
jgi:tRNA-splicing ligase RtcB (3'-phosphate/5'-hydroxy nucleic acid ligase)